MVGDGLRLFFKGLHWSSFCFFSMGQRPETRPLFGSAVFIWQVPVYTHSHGAPKHVP